MICFSFRVGYAGGKKVNPSYYSLGDHTETVDLDFDPNTVSYKVNKQKRRRAK